MLFFLCRCRVDSNKKLKDALMEFSGDIGLCKQQDEVGDVASTTSTTAFGLS